MLLLIESSTSNYSYNHNDYYNYMWHLHLHNRIDSNNHIHNIYRIYMKQHQDNRCNNHYNALHKLLGDMFH